ncbi:hypothetical protein BDF22DRAFT_743031 [Syncephalis plumigaleata]|nr:hypothetical protein BDF22DRAFT_743031 [Syncephalis plumigaleata]
MSGYNDPILPTHLSHNGLSSSSVGHTAQNVSATATTIANTSGKASPTLPYSYTSPNILYAADVLPELPVYQPDGTQNDLHLAVGTLHESGDNKLQIVSLSSNVGEDDQQPLALTVTAESDTMFPFTKIMGQSHYSRGLLATTSDMLRIWRYADDREIKLSMEAELCSGKSDMLAPLTSFDWSEIKGSLVVTCSVDTTCTVWDIEATKTQLIAHDREVYDVAFVAGSADIFASVGADGSVRMFDLRALDHSSIIYESPADEFRPQAPLLRLACNRKNANYLATFHMDSNVVQVLDARMPGTPFVELHGHTEPLTGIVWSPQEELTLCSCGEDGQVIMWDVKQTSSSGRMAAGSANSPTALNAPLVSPKGKFTHLCEANNVVWSRTRPDWVAVTSARLLYELPVLIGVLISLVLLAVQGWRLRHGGNLGYSRLSVDPALAYIDEELLEDDLEGEDNEAIIGTVKSASHITPTVIDYHTIRVTLDRSMAIRHLSRKRRYTADLLKLTGGLVVLSASAWEAIHRMEMEGQYDDGRDLRDHHPNHPNHRRLSFSLWQWQLIGTFAWIYIVLLSIVRLWFRKLAKTFKIHHSFQHGVISAFGAHIAVLGVFATRGPVDEAKGGRVQTLEKSASLLEWLFFDWITPLMHVGFKRRLDDLDLWELFRSDQVATVARQVTGHDHLSSAAHGVIEVCRKTMLKQLQYTVLGSLLMYSAPYFLVRLLEHVERPTTYSSSRVWVYVLGLFLSMVFSSICNQQSSFTGQHIKLRARAILSHRILEKYLKRRLPASSSSEQLFERDVKIISNAFKSLCTRIGGIIQIALAIWLLVYLIGTATIVGIAVMLVLFGVTKLIGKVSPLVYGNLALVTEQRISKVAEALCSMRIIKLLSWESQFATEIADIRDTETRILWRRQLMHTLLFIVSRGNSTIAACIALGFYAVVQEQALTATAAFTSLLVNRRITTFLESPNAPPAYESIDQDRRDNRNRMDSWMQHYAGQRVVQALTKLLKDMKLNGPEFNVISGPSGSGKTSLLLALIGEMPRIRGRIYLPKAQKNIGNQGVKASNVALVTQSVWLQTVSIRENILFGQPLVEQRYRQVLHACALERDLDMLEAGDRTIIGEKGVTISESLRQHVATARHIVEHCLLGPSMYNRTRIMVTKDFGVFARAATFAVGLQEGRVIATGEPASVMALSLLSSSESKATDASMDTAFSDANDKPGYQLHQQSQHHNKELASFATDSPSPYGDLISLTDYEDTHNKNGDTGIIKRSAFATYFNMGELLAIAMGARTAKGKCNIILLLDLRYTIWLGSNRGGLPHIVACDNVIYRRTDAWQDDGNDSRRLAHHRSCAAITLGHVLVDFSSMLFQLLIISLAIPIFLPVGILIATLYAFSVRFFLRASYSLQQLRSQSETQFYMNAKEMASGMMVIRASGLQRWFSTRCNTQIDNMNRSAYLHSACGHWIVSRLEWTSAFITAIVAALLIYSAHHFHAALIGFTLMYAISFTNSVSGTINNYSQIESNMNSMERLSEYLNVEQESNTNTEVYAPPEKWPQSGKIDIKNLIVSYAKSHIPALQDISLSIRQQLGAGKTTLAAALFRLVRPSSGKIIIDGVDISKISLSDLRSQLTIIPEDPGLFAGTLRSNLDPFSMHDDASIWNALHRSRIIAKEASGEKRTRFEHLDIAERRLLGIARALLQNNRVVIMDESATYINLDAEAKIQMIIREEFAHATLLRIAHRMRTVIDYDRVMVLDSGRLVEFDAPAQLLRRPDSLFRQLCEASGELGALMAMARCHLGSTV